MSVAIPVTSFRRQAIHVIARSRWVVVAWALAGCVPRAPTSNGAVGGVAAHSPSTLCPFGMRGVRVATDDVSGGVDVAVMAFGNDVTELRRRVELALQGTTADPSQVRGETANSSVSGSARSTADVGSQATPTPSGALLETPARINVEDVGHGLLVHARAARPDQVKALRDELRARIDHAVARKDCD